MMSSNPNLDPANTDTLIGMFRALFRDHMASVDGMIPAKVIGYTPGPPAKVQVQPLIKFVATDGTSKNRSQIAEVPVYTVGGGGFIMHTPLKPGDTGWLKACDRDISLFMQAAEQQQTEESDPNTHRIKSFSDGVFFPNTLHSYDVGNSDVDSLVLQSLDGQTKIVIADNSITIKAQNVVIDSDNLTVTGSLDVQGGMTCSGGTGPVTAAFTGDVTATGDITPNVPP